MKMDGLYLWRTIFYDNVLANYFNCSVDLMAGNNTQNCASFDEEMLLYIYRTMPEDRKGLFLAIGKTMAKYESPNKKNAATK